MGKTSYASSCNSRGSNLENNVLCKHNVGAVLKLAKKGENAGKWFYGCSLWPNNPCGFFQLADLCIENEDLEKKMLVEKLNRTKKKNEKLKTIVGELNSAIKKHRRSEKLMLYALLVSWVVFAIWCMCKNV